MTAETLEEVIKQRDKALARASELDGFRRYWKDKADTMVRKFGAAQAHAWELEQKLAALLPAREDSPNNPEIGASGKTES